MSYSAQYRLIRQNQVNRSALSHYELISTIATTCIIITHIKQEGTSRHCYRDNTKDSRRNWCRNSKKTKHNIVLIIRYPQGLVFIQKHAKGRVISNPSGCTLLRGGVSNMLPSTRESDLCFSPQQSINAFNDHPLKPSFFFALQSSHIYPLPACCREGPLPSARKEWSFCKDLTIPQQGKPIAVQSVKLMFPTEWKALDSAGTCELCRETTASTEDKGPTPRHASKGQVFLLRMCPLCLRFCTSFVLMHK